MLENLLEWEIVRRFSFEFYVIIFVNIFISLVKIDGRTTRWYKKVSIEEKIAERDGSFDLFDNFK